jgi:hypothetical protein
METITDYKILTDAVIADLVTSVKADIILGWIPVGGVTFDGNDYSQAMAKQSEKTITDYTVIHYNDLDSFISGVKAMLTAGWTMYGGKQGNGAGGYEQAFIKY